MKTSLKLTSLERNMSVTCLMLTFCLQAGAQTSIMNPLTITPRQENVWYSRLSVGDKVPEVKLEMINSAEPMKMLSDYKGKFIILDFWGTYCTDCIKHFPFLDSMQRKYDRQLQVLLVSTIYAAEKKEKLTTFFGNYYKRKGETLSFPCVVNDSILFSYFPHTSIPHVAIISPEGIVKAITGAKNVTEENLVRLLNHQDPGMRSKNDVMNYDSKKSLLENGNGGDTRNLLFRTSLTKYLDGMGGTKHDIIDGNLQKITYLNKPVLGLFDIAFGYPPGNRTIFITTDSSKYYEYLSTPEEWEKHLYCYEMVYPLNTPDSVALQAMQKDLNQFLDIEGHYETRIMTCWTVTLPEKNRFRKSGEKKFTLEKDSLGRNLIFQNVPLSMMLRELTYNSQKNIYVDETGIEEPIDCIIPIEVLQDPEQLSKILAPYGLKIGKTTRPIRMFILKEKQATAH